MRSGWDCYGKKYSIQSKEGNGLGRKSKKFCGGTVVLLLFLGFFFLVAAKPSAFALGSQGHTLVTQKALNILKNTDSSLYTTFMTFRGRCPELPQDDLPIQPCTGCIRGLLCAPSRHETSKGGAGS